MKRPVTSRGTIWRGELVAALLSSDDAAKLVARNLGLIQVEPQVVEPKPSAELADFIQSSAHVEAQIVDDYPANLEASYFWQPLRYEARAEIELPPSSQSKWQWRNPPQAPPESIPIASKRVVHPRLRTGVSSLSPGRGLDMPKIIRSLARGETLHEFPRKHLRRWGR